MTMTIEKCLSCEYANRQRDLTTGKPMLRCEVTGETLTVNICIRESTGVRTQEGVRANV